MTLTPYQIQFKQRMKRIIRLRAAADKKVRAHTRLLADALTAASTAASAMNLINQLYNVDVSTQTLLVHSLAEQVGEPLLTAVLAESQPGEEAVLFNQVPDANGGQPLPANPLFGESLAGTLTPAALAFRTEAKDVIPEMKTVQEGDRTI